MFYFVITACSIIKATLDLNDKSLLKMSKEFNDVERQINRPEMYEDERLSLEENILKQKVSIMSLLSSFSLIQDSTKISY